MILYHDTKTRQQKTIHTDNRDRAVVFDNVVIQIKAVAEFARRHDDVIWKRGFCWLFIRYGTNVEKKKNNVTILVWQDKEITDLTVKFIWDGSRRSQTSRISWGSRRSRTSRVSWGSRCSRMSRVSWIKWMNIYKNSKFSMDFVFNSNHQITIIFTNLLYASY